MVVCLAKGRAGDLGQANCDRSSETGQRVDAGTDRSATQRQLRQPRQTGLDPLDAGLDLGCVAAKLLAQPHRHRIHQVGAAGFQRIIEGNRLVQQRSMQVMQSGQ